jgi:NADH:ubiquinone oxidoreductase subunit F (NADH-binding)
VGPATGPLSLERHLDVHGPRPSLVAGHLSPELLHSAIEAANLRGRGGGGYPLAKKISQVASGKGRKMVVVNGAESEPASRKDAVLLGRSPHLVLDGAVLAAELVGAEEVVVWLHQDPTMPPLPVDEAVNERARSGYDEVFIRVEYGPARYVAGESSALVNHLSGGDILPTLSPPHATERGVLGLPTLVSNAETMAHLALIARHGPDWYREVGTDSEPGTQLVTVTGGVDRPLVLEVPYGALIGEVIRSANLVEEPSAVLVGGYAGTWLPWSQIAYLPLTRGALKRAGASLGVGMLAPLPASRCGLVETAHVVDWLAGQTAGQCGPCVNGLPAIASALWSLAEGRATAETAGRLVRWTGMVAGRGLCHHPDGVVMLVRSALRTFHAETSAHLHGHCSGRSYPAPLLPVPVDHS